MAPLTENVPSSPRMRRRKISIDEKHGLRVAEVGETKFHFRRIVNVRQLYRSSQISLLSAAKITFAEKQLLKSLLHSEG